MVCFKQYIFFVSADEVSKATSNTNTL